MNLTNSIQDFIKSSAILGRTKIPTPYFSSPASKKYELNILAFFESRGNLPDRVKLAKTLSYIQEQIKNLPSLSLSLDYDFLGLELYKRCKDKEAARKAIRLFRKVNKGSIRQSEIEVALGVTQKGKKELAGKSDQRKPSTFSKKLPSTKVRSNIQKVAKVGYSENKPLQGFSRYPYFQKFGCSKSEEYSDDLRRKLENWPGSTTKVFSCIKEFQNSHHEWDEDPIHRK